MRGFGPLSHALPPLFLFSSLPPPRFLFCRGYVDKKWRNQIDLGGRQSCHRRLRPPPVGLPRVPSLPSCVLFYQFAEVMPRREDTGQCGSKKASLRGEGSATALSPLFLFPSRHLTSSARIRARHRIIAIQLSGEWTPKSSRPVRRRDRWPLLPSSSHVLFYRSLPFVPSPAWC